MPSRKTRQAARKRSSTHPVNTVTAMKPYLLLLFILLPANAWALRCGNQLVQVGDRKIEVLDKCGEPDMVDRRFGIRGSRLRHPPQGALEIDQFEEVEIEEWIYDFGRRKFRQFLRFENGELKQIDNLGYGR